MKRRCVECHEETEQVHEVKAPEQGGAWGKDRAAAVAEEAVLRQDLMGTVFAQTAVKECPTKWEFPAISRNALSAGRL